MASTGGSETAAIVLARLEEKIDHISEQIKPVAELCNRVSVMDVVINGKQGVLERLAQIEERVDGLEILVKPWIRVLSVIAALLGATLIAFIWSILINQVSIVVP
jgi:hypothetical protein